MVGREDNIRAIRRFTPIDIATIIGKDNVARIGGVALIEILTIVGADNVRAIT
jgi:hypothetical protein